MPRLPPPASPGGASLPVSRREDTSLARTVAVAALVATVTLVAFRPAVSAGFLNWDDDLLLLENPNWRGFSPHNIAWMFKTTYMGPYQPLAWITYAIDDQLWGLRPEAFHATNLVLHTLTAAIFFLLARRLFRITTQASEPLLDLLSAAAALLFSVHPLRVESVAWITERRDVLCGVFFVAALLVYVRAAEQQAKADRPRVVGPGCVFLVALAALSKGWAMTLPALMFVLDFYPLSRRPRTSWRRLIGEKLPILVIAALTAVIAYLGQRSGAWGPQQYAHRSVAERIAQASNAILFYPMKTLWPSNLLPIYELPGKIRLIDPHYAGAAFAVLALTTAAWLARHRWPAALAAWLAYLFTIAPFIGIAHAGNQIVADRYSYLSCLAFPLLAIGGLAIAARSSHLRVVTYAGCAASVVIIALLAGQTWRLTTAWHDSLSLWRRAVAVNPQSWVSQCNLGDALRKSGAPSDARKHFEYAVAINPRAGIAWLNLGEILKGESRYPEAEAALTQAVQHHPEPALAHLQLGEICARSGRPGEALEHFFEAASNPRTAAWAEFGAGVILQESGRNPEALDHLRRAAQIDPSIPGVAQALQAAEALSRSRVYPTSGGEYKKD